MVFIFQHFYGLRRSFLCTPSPPQFFHPEIDCKTLTPNLQTQILITSHLSLPLLLSPPFLMVVEAEIYPRSRKRKEMRSIITKIPSKYLLRRILSSPSPISISSHYFSTETSRTQMLERIADELMSLNPIELHNYSILFRLKMGLKNSASLSSGLDPSAAGHPGASAGGDAKVEEKTVFDVKLEKFDAAAKIKIIKEVRSFTDLGLKEAKDLVEKTPIVVKKGVAKEEGDSIVEKLKQLGATVVLE